MNTPLNQLKLQNKLTNNEHSYHIKQFTSNNKQKTERKIHINYLTTD